MGQEDFVSLRRCSHAATDWIGRKADTTERANVRAGIDVATGMVERTGRSRRGPSRAHSDASGADAPPMSGQAESRLLLWPAATLRFHARSCALHPSHGREHPPRRRNRRQMRRLPLADQPIAKNAMRFRLRFAPTERECADHPKQKDRTKMKVIPFISLSG